MLDKSIFRYVLAVPGTFRTNCFVDWLWCNTAFAYPSAKTLQASPRHSLHCSLKSTVGLISLGFGLVIVTELKDVCCCIEMQSCGVVTYSCV